MTRTMSETLRTVADLIEQHPDLPHPGVTIYSGSPDQADVWWYIAIDNPNDPAEQKAKTAQVIRAIGGHWDKDFDWGDTDRADFVQTRDGIQLRIVVERSAVCERVVTGTETVTLPAVEAQPERTEERETVEWRCEPLLSGATS